MLALGLLTMWGCVNCERTTHVDVEATDAAGEPVVIDAATLTLTDGSTLDMECVAYDGSPGGTCWYDLVDGGDPESVTITVGTVEVTGTEFEFYAAEECGMTPHYRLTLTLPP